MQVDGKAGPYEFLTYAEVGELVAGIGAALMAAGLEARQKCAIYGVNCTEWMIAMQASTSHTWHAGQLGPSSRACLWQDQVASFLTRH